MTLKVDVTGPRKYTVCRRVRASFSPEIVQAGTMKGLMILHFALLSIVFK